MIESRNTSGDWTYELSTSVIVCNRLQRIASPPIVDGQDRPGTKRCQIIVTRFDTDEQIKKEK
jgi:hypothetical protein